MSPRQNGKSSAPLLFCNWLICIYLSPSNRARLERLVADRNTRSKVIWRAGIVLATADVLKQLHEFLALFHLRATMKDEAGASEYPA